MGQRCGTSHAEDEAMNDVKRYVPRILRDDGMIEASEVAHYEHLKLIEYVPATALAQAQERIRHYEQLFERHLAREKYMAEIVFQHVKHGDEKHQEWLRAELVKVICTENTKSCKTFDDLTARLAAMEKELHDAKTQCGKNAISHMTQYHRADVLQQQLATAQESCDELRKDRDLAWHQCEEWRKSDEAIRGVYARLLKEHELKQHEVEALTARLAAIYATS